MATSNVHLMAGLACMSDTIANNTDLNNVTKPGTYYANNVTATNKPTGMTTKYFHLVVIGLVSGASVIQILSTLGTDYVYYRGHYGTTWTAWRRVTST